RSAGEQPLHVALHALQLRGALVQVVGRGGGVVGQQGELRLAEGGHRVVEQGGGGGVHQGLALVVGGGQVPAQAAHLLRGGAQAVVQAVDQLTGGEGGLVGDAGGRAVGGGDLGGGGGGGHGVCSLVVRCPGGYRADVNNLCQYTS